MFSKICTADLVPEFMQSVSGIRMFASPVCTTRLMCYD